jgi:hypothetical protein
MHKRTENGLFARILIVAICLAAIAYVLWGVAYSLGKSEGEYLANSDTYATHAEQEIRDECLILETTSSVECIRRVLEATNEHERSEADLKAQERMASWAFYMFIASSIATVSTLYGLFLIRQTWFETRRASTLTERAIKNEERPYLVARISDWVFLPGHIAEEGVGDVWGGIFTNLGTKPARLTRFFAVVQYLPPVVYPEPIRPDQIGGRKFPSGFFVGSQQNWGTQFINRKNFESGRSDAVKDGSLVMWRYGFIRYADVSGAHYITGFAIRGAGSNGECVIDGDDRYNYFYEESDSSIPEPVGFTPAAQHLSEVD